MWVLLLLIPALYSESIDSSVIDTYNSMYELVSGTSTPLYSFYTLLDCLHSENSTSYTMLLLANSTLTAGLSLHYLQIDYINNSTDIKLHTSPAFEPLENYTKAQLNDEFFIDLVTKYSLVEIFSVEVQTLQFDNSSEYRLLEVVYAGNGALHKAYSVMNGTDSVKIYDWGTSKGIVSHEKSSSKYLALLGLIISGGITAVIIYFYWHSRKAFPCLKVQEEEMRITRGMP